jgi:3'(2'), 5'-bisphosphate nucleotidase
MSADRLDGLTGLDDHQLAAELARRAGDLLLDLRAADPSSPDLGKEGDCRANELLLAGLALARPDDAVLSEEAADDARRLDHRRVWIIDPLDGTREFGEAGRTDWAVHVALAVDGIPVAGAVALPAQGIVLSTSPAPTLPEDRSAGEPPRLVVSRTRPPAITEPLRAVLGAELVPMGSAGAKVAAVIQGLAEVYAHAGGQYEWDSAAPVAVAAAAGLHCSRLDGSPLRYNQPNPWMPDLLVTRSGLASEVLDALAGDRDLSDRGATT